MICWTTMMFCSWLRPPWGSCKREGAAGAEGLRARTDCGVWTCCCCCTAAAICGNISVSRILVVTAACRCCCCCCCFSCCSTCRNCPRGDTSAAAAVAATGGHFIRLPATSSVGTMAALDAFTFTVFTALVSLPPPPPLVVLLRMRGARVDATAATAELSGGWCWILVLRSALALYISIFVFTTCSWSATLEHGRVKSKTHRYCIRCFQTVMNSSKSVLSSTTSSKKRRMGLSS
mmetsp:Transcript_22139/g.46341  ORF Transcript_22139/g.46341 Transcript_22139/m.46341 type:complete len:234 (-) Transcript_22139:625-1326(-)